MTKTLEDIARKIIFIKDIKGYSSYDYKPTTYINGRYWEDLGDFIFEDSRTNDTLTYTTIKNITYFCEKYKYNPEKEWLK